MLGEVTNRVSTRSQSNMASYNSKTMRERNSSFGGAKVGRQGGLAKTIVEANNNTLILEINKFRLLFKIWERMKKHASEEKEVMNCIGNDVLKRVNNLMSVLHPDKENVGSCPTSDLRLGEAQAYLSEETNSGVKKYKAVVKEYHKKYHQEISTAPMGRQMSSQQGIR